MSRTLAMSRIRLLALGMLGVVVACAAAASSASAVVFTLTDEPCRSPDTTHTICWALFEKEELFELSGEQSFTGKYSAEVTGEENLLAAKFGEEEVHIVCIGASSSGTASQTLPLVRAPVFHGTLISTGCKLLETVGKKCVVKEELVTNEIEGVAGASSEEELFQPAPGTGGIFIGIAFANNGAEKCPTAIVGTQHVKGSQLCLWPHHEEDLQTQLLFCETAGSKLTLGGNKAEFLQAQEITFVGLNDFWDIVLA
jgi:hypothetical protein